jgi:hypothetical protein
MKILIEKCLLLLETILLIVPFPGTIVWWIFLGTTLGTMFFGPNFIASVGIIPVAILGVWRGLVRQNKRKNTTLK